MDDGETWQPTALSLSTSNGTYFRRLVLHPQNSDIMLATSSKGIYKTTDAWETYSLVQAGDFKDLEFNPGNPDIIYATSFSSDGNAKIYKSTNGGNSFSITNSGLNINGLVNRIELAVTKANTDLIYALCSSASNSGFYAFYRSTNNGESWSLLYDDNRENLLGWSPAGTDIGGQGWYDLALAVSPTNSDDIIVGGINLWRSDNGGTKWELSSWLYHTESFDYVHADQHMLTYSHHSNTLFAANDGGIYSSENNGIDWSDKSSNLQILQSYKLGSSSTNKNKIICGNQDNGTFFLNETKWSMVLGGDGMFCYIDPSNEETLYGSAYNGAIYKSENSGEEFVSIKPESNLNGAWITPFIIHPQNPTVLYAAYKDIYQSDDAGENWHKISEELSQENLRTLAVAPSNDNYIYTSTYKRIFKTTNRGVMWEEVPTGFSDLSITSICISPNDPNKIWISLSGYNELDKVFYSANGGISWINYSSGLPNTPINKIVMRYNSNNELFAATDIGVYYRNADTSNWTNYSISLPNAIVSDLEIIEAFNTIRVATYGRGIWEASLPPTLPSKADFEANIVTGCLDAPIQLYYTDSVVYDSLVWVLSDAQLLGNTSNNDTINIKYSLPGKKTIQLKHYKDNTIINEIKYEYLDIRDTLDLTLSPAQYYVCDSSKLKIELRKGYDYIWTPDLYIDTTQGNSVVISPLENITYHINAKHGNCQTTIDLPILYMPDNVCDALFLPTGYAGYFSNDCATFEESEPIPPVGTGENDGCISQDGWCNDQNKLENTLWYKIVIPENGRVRIRINGFDSQIALYSATSFADLLSGNYDFIAANDDISTTNSDSEIDIEDGLTTGDTLYLQLDGSFEGATGEFKISVSDQPSSIKELKKYSNGFSVTFFPNPAHNFTHLIIDNCGGKNLTIELISQTGNIIIQKIVTPYSPTYKTTINTLGLNGLYILRVSTKEQIENKKLVVF